MITRQLILAGSAVAISAALLMSSGKGDCKNRSWSCLSGKCSPKSAETFDETTKSLIFRLSHQPELMNVEYLKYFIGRPANEKTQQGTLSKTYFWYDGHRQVQYELVLRESAPAQVTDATMVAHLAGQGVTFEQVHATYGAMSRRFFDYNGHPSELFSFAPDTYLSFSSPPGTFRVSQAKITYRGQILKQPDSIDMHAAEDDLLRRAESVSSSETASAEIIPLLRARVKCRPLDAESHLLLARALARQSLIHEAIGEYKIALAMSSGNNEVKEQSLAALKQMKLIRIEPDQSARRNMEIVDNGQHIHVRGLEKKSHKKPNSDNDGKDKDSF